jgi:hypothetical protein
LPQLVSNLLADLNDAVETRIGKVFDMESIGKEVAQKGQSESLHRLSRRIADETLLNGS